jgi:hypothetical protein
VAGELQTVLTGLLGTVPTLEVRTALTPPFQVSTAVSSGGPPNPFATFAKPTIVGLGTDGVTELFTIAPYGEAGPTDWIPYGIGAGLAVLLVVGLIFWAGRASK